MGKNMLKPYKCQSMVCRCRFCSFDFICKDFIVCPCCGSKNIHVVPMQDNKRFTLSWLESHGFPFFNIINKNGGGSGLLSEDEIRNWLDLEVSRVEDIVDPVERICCRITISTLDGVLNE